MSSSTIYIWLLFFGINSFSLGKSAALDSVDYFAIFGIILSSVYVVAKIQQIKLEAKGE